VDLVLDLFLIFDPIHYIGFTNRKESEMKALSFLATLIVVLSLVIIPANAARMGRHTYSGGHFDLWDHSSGHHENVVVHNNWYSFHRNDVNFKRNLQPVDRDWNHFVGNWDRTWNQWDNSWDNKWIRLTGDSSPNKEYILDKLRELIDRASQENCTPVFRQIGHIRDSRIWETTLPAGEYYAFVSGGAGIENLAVRVTDAGGNRIAEDDQSNPNPSVWFTVDGKTALDIEARVWTYNYGFNNDYVCVLLCKK
jgi:hypothetical protein